MKTKLGRSDTVPPEGKMVFTTNLVALNFNQEYDIFILFSLFFLVKDQDDQY